MIDALHLILYAGGVRLVRLSNRTFGFARTVQTLGLLAGIKPGPRASQHPVSTLAAAVSAVSGPPYHASCLDRSVFLWFLMQRRGFNGSLRIGITLDADELQGHAWVEFQGTVVNDDADVADHFSVFDDDPAGIVFT